MKRNVYIIIAIILGLGLRIAFAKYGHNYDFESYELVTQAIRANENVYVATSRYNYGPIWFNVLGLLDWLSGIGLSFRYLVAGLLSLVDLGITYILYRKYSWKTALLFFFNPISIIVTGFISQFDNLAILLGLLSVMTIGNTYNKHIDRRKIIGLIILGISLATKHIFFFLPLWIAIKQKGLKQKITTVLIPISIFFFSFIPYLNNGGFESIWENVFRYSSVKNAPLLNLALPEGWVSVFLANTLLLVALFGFGLYFKKKSNLDTALLYTLILTVFSPAIIHNHIAIPIAAIAVFPNTFFFLFTALSTYILTLDRLGLNIEVLVNSAPKNFLFKYSSVNIFGVPILFLTLGLFLYLKLKTTNFRRLGKWFNARVREQINEF